jgi:hypothetical protein
MTPRRWVALALGLFIAPAGCATSEVADPDGEEDGADQGGGPGGDLSWLADRAKFIGSLEPTSSTDTDGKIHYRSESFDADLGTDGFHKFTLPTLQGAGFDTIVCAGYEGFFGKIALWPSGDPVICLMGPKFHDCSTKVENVTRSDGTKERRWFYANVERDGPWTGATLAVVTTKQNLARKDVVDKVPLPYHFACSYFDEP